MTNVGKIESHLHVAGRSTVQCGSRRCPEDTVLISAYLLPSLRASAVHLSTTQLSGSRITLENRSLSGERSKVNLMFIEQLCGQEQLSGRTYIPLVYR